MKYIYSRSVPDRSVPDEIARKRIGLERGMEVTLTRRRPGLTGKIVDIVYWTTPSCGDYSIAVKVDAGHQLAGEIMWVAKEELLEYPR